MAKKMKEIANERTGENVYRGDNLKRDFSSFDVLWFDLSTKVREEIKALNEPIYNNLHETKKHLKKHDKAHEDAEKKVAEIDSVVFKRNGEMDIFREIFAKITQVEADRKTVEARLE